MNITTCIIYSEDYKVIFSKVLFTYQQCAIRLIVHDLDFYRYYIYKQIYT